MDLVPTRRPGDYTLEPAQSVGGTLAAAAHEARYVRPGEWVFVGYRTVKEPWVLNAWIREVRNGKRPTLSRTPGEWDATHILGVMIDGEFIPDEPDERAEGGERTAAKYIAYVGTVAA